MVCVCKCAPKHGDVSVPAKSKIHPTPPTAQQSGVEAFRGEFMAGATYRPGKRADDDGLPFTLINGLKYRPVRRGQEWLRSRIKTLGHAKLRRRR
jgi:hypothetical protein